jgi:hypothetical protein
LEEGRVAGDQAPVLETGPENGPVRRARFDAMIDLLEKAVAGIRRLPEDRQDMAAEILLDIAAQEPMDHRLTAEAAG